MYLSFRKRFFYSVFLLFLLLSIPMAEEKFGAIKGKVLEASSFEPITGVEIIIAEINQKALSDLDGNFFLPGIKPGTYTLQAAASGYETVTVPDLEFKAGDTLIQTIELKESQAFELQQMTVRAVASKSSEASLLKNRKMQISFTDAIGGIQISRSGASNAADAMKGVTGATVVGGKYVLIRGLPERYTVTMLNGSPIPSPDPDKKAVNMDLFPAGMIENITTFKTFTPDLPGNFAGGVVDIKTKPFPDKLMLSVSAKGAYKQYSTLNDRFLDYGGGKYDWAGFDDGTRAMPEIYNQYSKVEIDEISDIPDRNFNFRLVRDELQNPDSSLSHDVETLNSLVRTLDTTMTPYEKTAPFNQSYSLSFGNRYLVATNPLGLRLGITYKNKFTHSPENIKRNYSFSTWNDAGGNEPTVDNDFRRTNSENGILWGVLGNTAYKLGDNHLLKTDYIYTRITSDNVQRVTGRYGYYENMGTFKTYRLHYVERMLNHIQPTGIHRIPLSDYHVLQIDWMGAYTNSVQNEPDLRNIYHFEDVDRDSNRVYKYVANLGNPTHKWRELNEDAISADLKISIPFYQWSDDSGTVKTGASFLRKNRKRRERVLEYQVENYQGYIQSYRSDLSDSLQYTAAQDFITQDQLGFIEDTTVLSGIRPGLLIKDYSSDPAQWDGKMDVLSGFAMIEIPLVYSLSTTMGLRIEKTDLFGQSIIEEWQIDSLSANLENIDFLPSFSLNYGFSKNMNLRTAYGRTLVRPSMREMALYTTEAFTSGPSFIGNPDLERSVIDNADIRWEWFMKPGELLAMSLYGKRIRKPIEMTFLNNDIRQPANTDSAAFILGTEFEARKRLNMIKLLKNFEVAGNMTLTWSRVKLDSSQGVDAKMAKLNSYFPGEPNYRPFQGQSPYVANVFLTYDNPNIGLNLNLYYNVFGERLGELTDQDMPWIWEKPEHMLNSTAKLKFGPGLSWSFKAGNLLNQSKQYVHRYNGQEYLVEEKKSGRSFETGIGYSF